MKCITCMFFEPEQTEQYGECILNPVHEHIADSDSHYCGQHVDKESGETFKHPIHVWIVGVDDD